MSLHETPSERGPVADMRAERRRREIDKLHTELAPVLRHLDDPEVTEVLRNEDGRLWADRLGAGLGDIGSMADDEADRIIRVVAALKGRRLGEESPIIECELPFRGERFTAAAYPVVAAPIFSIRKRALRVLTLADYVRDGRLSPPACDLLEAAVARRRNILVAGPTSSGKTTLCNALIRAIADVRPADRMLTIEDVRELQLEQRNVVHLVASEFTSQRTLLKTAMRLRPDAICVGEVRDGAALDLLKAWNTGHPGGVTTLHADSAVDALDRLEMLIAEAAGAPTPEQLGRLVARAVDLVVFMGKGRGVEEILRIEGHENGRYLATSLGRQGCT